MTVTQPFQLFTITLSNGVFENEILQFVLEIGVERSDGSRCGKARLEPFHYLRTLLSHGWKRNHAACTLLLSFWLTQFIILHSVKLQLNLRLAFDFLTRKNKSNRRRPQTDHAQKNNSRTLINAISISGFNYKIISQTSLSLSLSI